MQRSVLENKNKFIPYGCQLITDEDIEEVVKVYFFFQIIQG